MTDWIEKLPEPLLPIAAAAGLWFGFNYVVLAERAMAKDQASLAIPQCLEVLDRHSLANRLRPTGLSGAFGLPQLDRLEREVIAQYGPRPLSAAEKHSRCSCAASRAATKLRWDYAVHTATFRLASPQSVSALTDEASAIVLAGMCDALPRLRVGE